MPVPRKTPGSEEIGESKSAENAGVCGSEEQNPNPQDADTRPQIDTGKQAGRSKVEIGPLARWAMKHYTIPKTGEKYSFKGHGYLFEIANDLHPEQCTRKSAQCGISELMVVLGLWTPDELGENVIYAMPAQSQMDKFSHARIQRAIDFSQYIRGRVSGVTNAGQKAIGKGILYCIGSQEYRQLITIDADVLIVDEVDGHKQENIPILDARLGHSKRKWKRYISTPTYPSYGIDEMYNKSDQREWFIKCEHCGEWQTLTWEDNVVELPHVHVVCCKCRKQINRLSMGRWVPRFRENDVHGYYINKLFCERTDLEAMWKRSQDPRPYVQQRFYNDDLGLPYVPKGASISREDVSRVAILPERRSVARNELVVAGADVGPTYIHTVGSMVTAQRIRKRLFIEKVRSFDELEELWRRFHVKVGVVDAQPETRKAQELCDKPWPRSRIWRCYFVRGTSEYSREASTHKLSVNKTLACDAMVAAFRDEFLLLPKSAMANSEYVAQLTTPMRTIVDPNIEGVGLNREGKERHAIWIKTNKPDHYFFAEVYEWLAFDMAPSPARTISGNRFR